MKTKIIEDGEVTGVAEGGPDTEYSWWYQGDLNDVHDVMMTAERLELPNHVFFGIPAEEQHTGSSMESALAGEKVRHVWKALQTNSDVDDVVLTDG